MIHGIVGGFVIFVVGYLLGRRHERLGWEDLVNPKVKRL